VPNDDIRSYVSHTAARAPTSSVPCRLVVTGSGGYRVTSCTGGEDAVAIGMPLAGRATGGLSVPVALNEGFQFQGYVNTTVALGAKLKLLNGSQFQAAVAQTSGIPTRYCARAVKARTNAGRTWLEFVPHGVV
jgi:hypothetical protein